MAHSITSGAGAGIAAVSRLRRAVVRWFRQQTDLMPPYHIYEGDGWTRRSDGDGFFLELGDDLVEVDGITYGLLEPGETIRVRYTRGMRAINADRFPRGDPGLHSNE